MSSEPEDLNGRLSYVDRIQKSHGGHVLLRSSGVSTVVVKRFIRRSPGGGARYSIRRRADGLFQAYDDNIYAGLGYGYEDEPISGIFADYEQAEAELLRIRSGLEPET